MTGEDATTELSEVRQRLAALVAPEAADRAQAAWRAYETARADGLCHDGAWECALAALARPSAG